MHAHNCEYIKWMFYCHVYMKLEPRVLENPYLVNESSKVEAGANENNIHKWWHRCMGSFEWPWYPITWNHTSFIPPADPMKEPSSKKKGYMNK